MEVNVVGVKTYVEFQGIEVIGDKDPYPTLLGLNGPLIIMLLLI